MTMEMMVESVISSTEAMMRAEMSRLTASPLGASPQSNLVTTLVSHFW